MSHNPLELTVLTAAMLLTKTYMVAPDGKVVLKSYDEAKIFDAATATISTIEELYRLLCRLDTKTKSCVIRASLKKGRSPMGARRCLHPKDDLDDPPFEAVDRAWVCWDMDHLRPDFDTDPGSKEQLERAAFWLRQQMEEPFRSAACVVCWSSRAFTDVVDDKLVVVPRQAKAHLWFILDKPAGERSLTGYAQVYGIDPVTTRTVQIHYTARPLFLDGLVDPVATRVMFLPGISVVDTSLCTPALYNTAEGELRKEEEQQKRLAEREKNPPRPVAPEESVIDAFIARYSVVEVLQWFGYEPTKDPRRLNRPGVKSQGIWIGPNNKICCHSTSDPLWSPDNHPRNPFDVLCILGHDGDAKAAVKEAAQMLGMNKPSDHSFPPPPNDDDYFGPPSRPTPPPMNNNTPPPPIPQPVYTPTSPPEMLDTISPEEARSIFNPGRTTEQGNAERLVEQYGQDLHYNPKLGWMAWDGACWQIEKGQHNRLYKNIVRQIFVEAAGEADRDIQKEIWKWAKRSETARVMSSSFVMAESEPGIRIEADDLDKNPWLLNLQNGTLDLQTKQLNTPDRNDLITKQLNIQYQPEEQCPVFLKFLNRIMEGSQEMVDFLQRAVGYSLTGSTREQTMFIMHGSGQNGKSTFINVLANLLGEYAQKTPATTLMMKQHDEGIPNDVARMAGARLVTSVETEEGKRLSEVRIKEMTGGDKIAARFLRQEFFEFTPQFKIWMATNHKPVIRGTDKAIWRRIKLIPFVAKIQECEKDPELGGKLYRELPGILNWAIEGCLQWQKIGLLPPAIVVNATQQYQEEQDVLASFLEECCTLADGLSSSAKELYATYVAWCESHNEYCESQRKFGLRLSERGLENYKGSKNHSYWKGIGIVCESASFSETDL